MEKGKARDDESYLRFLAYLGETGLEPRVREVCLRWAVTPKDIYLDVRGPSTLAARLEVWWRLWKIVGKTPAEIATMFDRDASSVKYGLGRLYKKAESIGVQVDGARLEELCRLIASETRDNWERAGRNAFTKIKR